MHVVLLIELEKLLRQKKTWFSLVILNGVGIGFLLAVIAVPMMLLEPQGVEAVRNMTPTPESALAARRFLAGAVLFWAASFSFLATFTLALQSGSVFAAEFGDDSIQMMLLAPVNRLQVWAGKVLSVVSLYLGGWLVGLALAYVAYLRLAYLSPSFDGLLWQLPLKQMLGTYVLVDLTTLAFFLWVSVLMSSGTTASLGGLGLYVLLIFLGFFLASLQYLPAVTGLMKLKDPWVFELWRTYGFPGAVRSVKFQDLAKFLMNPDGVYPLEASSLSATAGWLVFFLALGALTFQWREAQPDS